MNFSPNRLTTARKRRLLTKKALAEMVNIAPLTITRCENGDTSPSPETVSILARALEFPESFFYGEELQEAGKGETSFRSQTAMTAALRDAALAAGSIGFMVSDWVEKRFNLPEPCIPDLSDNPSPEQAARALRERWALGEKPISNIIHLLESKGVRIFSLAENTTTVNAYCLWRNGTPYVFLNTYKSAESSRFDAAHELGHLVLHQDAKVTGRAAEDQANAFASAFLMPKADILANLPPIIALNQVILAKARWKVSAIALCYRLHKLGLISEWKYRDFCIELSKNGYLKKEPLAITREKSLVWDKVLKTLWQDGTTHSDIARDLHLPESEVSSLLVGVVRPDEEDGPKPIRPSVLKVLESSGV